ncbi:hypothetical protein BMS3Abin04_00325 [bacterium BMS3Abin04]|nr:hypothetical protein BMS3Abin04_00325 [bacterium BMS3Abin04]
MRFPNVYLILFSDFENTEFVNGKAKKHINLHLDKKNKCDNLKLYNQVILNIGG